MSLIFVEGFTRGHVLIPKRQGVYMYAHLSALAGWALSRKYASYSMVGTI